MFIFAAKTRVALKGNRAPFAKGTTVNDSDKDLVIVEWDDGKVQKIDVRKLLLETEASAEEQRVMEAIVFQKKKAAEEKAAKEAEEARLEAEFQTVKGQVDLKLREAGDALSEAVAIANKYHKNLEYDFDSSPLIDAMEDAGWNTSSLSC